MPRLLAIAALALALALPAANAQTSVPIGSIAVEAGPVVAETVGNKGAVLATALEDALAAAFAQRRADDGARLTVRLEDVRFANIGAPNLAGAEGAAAQDYLVGTATLTRRGETIAREELRVSYPAAATAAAADERARAVNLARAWADWLVDRI